MKIYIYMAIAGFILFAGMHNNEKQITAPVKQAVKTRPAAPFDHVTIIDDFFIDALSHADYSPVHTGKLFYVATDNLYRASHRYNSNGKFHSLLIYFDENGKLKKFINRR